MWLSGPGVSSFPSAPWATAQHLAWSTLFGDGLWQRPLACVRLRDSAQIERVRNTKWAETHADESTTNTTGCCGQMGEQRRGLGQPVGRTSSQSAGTRPERKKPSAPRRAESFLNPGARDRNRTDDLILTMDALLPTELRGRAPYVGRLKMVAGAGFEPATSGL